ncbi:MAG: ABC transporter permease [Spirochaetaceae bacterium]|jgi:NitT/TauT family transport system permease protein|nr:ABC transporter permease [Spirochaetaceae bacterium]
MKKPRLNHDSSLGQNREWIKNTLLSLIPIALFFLFWQAASYQIPRGVLSSPARIARGMYRAFTDPKGEILKHTLISLEHIGLGFLLAGIVGAAFGFLLGTFFKPLERLFIPFFHVCEKLNPFAIVPVFMFLFGIGREQKIAVVFWACVWPVLFNIQEAAKSVDLQLIRAARAMGAGRLKLFSAVILPCTLPSIFTGFRLAIRVAFFMIVMSELLGASSGLGWYYMQQTYKYKLDLMYGSILYITVLTITASFLLGLLEKHFLAWKQKTFQ